MGNSLMMTASPGRQGGREAGRQGEDGLPEAPHRPPILLCSGVVTGIQPRPRSVVQDLPVSKTYVDTYKIVMAMI